MLARFGETPLRSDDHGRKWPCAQPDQPPTGGDEPSEHLDRPPGRWLHRTDPRVALLWVEGRELEVWSQIWRTPQAAAWITLGWTFDIALYVRWQVAASESEAATLTEALKAGNEARQWSDRLGLNPTAMLKNRWRVRSDEVTEKRAEKTTAAKTKARRRLKVADNAVAEA
jgi:hypothetical protein